MKLEFSVEEQTLKAIPTESVPHMGSRKYLQLVFHLSSDWDGYVPVVFFQGDKQQIYPAPIKSGEPVTVPDIYLTKPSFQIFVLGIDGEVAVPTNVISVNLGRSGSVWLDRPEAPEMPVFQELIALVQTVLDREPEIPTSMKSFFMAMEEIRNAGSYGVPVVEPGEAEAFRPMELSLAAKESSEVFKVPTVGKVDEKIKDALLSGYVDVTEEYGKALAAGQVNGAREYLWTLGAGRYSLAHESGWLYLEALAGIDQGNGSEIGMVLYDVGEFLTISVYGNIGLSDQPIFRLDGETGEIWCHDKKLHVYDGLIFKDRKLFLSARKTPVGDGVEFPKANLAQTDPSAGNYVEGRELLLGNVKTVNGQAPDDKGNVEISIPEGGTGGGLTKAQINALDAMFKVCAFIKPDVSAEYNAFITAFATGGGGEEPEPDIPDEPTGAPVVSISVTYIGGDVAVGTALTALTGITVTATYSDGSTANVSGYTLSGTIAEGDNIITVSFGGKVAMFTVVGIGVSTGVSNEVAWADGVAYDYALVSNHYVDDKNGALVPYNGYNMTPYLYCNGASKLRIQMKASAASVNSNAKYNAFYDADKNFIQNINYSNMMDTTTAGAYCDIDIPTNASYFVMSHKSDALKYVDFIPLA